MEELVNHLARQEFPHEAKGGYEYRSDRGRHRIHCYIDDCGLFPRKAKATEP